MSFFAYNKLLNMVDSEAYDSASEVPFPIDAPGCRNHHDSDGIVVLEYPDYDPDTDYVNSLRVNAAGTALENPQKGKTFAEQKTLDEAYRDSTALKSTRVHKRDQLKGECGELIRLSAWEDVKAADTDAINGNDSATRALYEKRQKMRDQNSAAETTLLDLTDLEEVKNFDVRSKSWYTP